MVDTPEGDNTPTTDDVVKNIKAEFQRKFEAVTKTSQQLAEQNAALNSKIDLLLNSVNSKQTQATQEEDETLRYVDPDAYVAKKIKEVESKVDQKIAATQQINDAKINTLNQLAQQYPEIGDSNSDLYQKALDIAKGYDKNFMSTPEGLRLVVREAAAELGVLPANKRSKNEESSEEDMSEFIGGGNNKPKTPPKANDKISEKTKAFAELMGLDVNDPKVVARLKEHAKRDYRKWK